MASPQRPSTGAREDERFHATGLDLLYMEKWVDDLLSMNDKELDPPRIGSINHFKEQARRYNACFAELTRKTTVLHPELSRLYKKVWRGTGHFVSRLLSDYEFQLTKGGELEDKMRETLEASQIKVFWNSKETEKAKVDFALQRARSIEFQSELEMLREKAKRLQADNDYLRGIIVRFIEGQGEEERYLAAEEEEGKEEGEEGGEEQGREDGEQHVSIVETPTMAAGEGAGGGRPSSPKGPRGTLSRNNTLSPKSGSAGPRTSSSTARTSSSTLSRTASSSSRVSMASQGTATSSSSSLATSPTHTARQSTGSRSGGGGSMSNNGKSGSRISKTGSSLSSGAGSNQSATSSAASSADSKRKLDEDARKTLSLSLLEKQGKDKCQNLHARSDHLDKVMQDIVSEGLKQEHYLTEIDLLLRNNDLTALFAAASKDSRRDRTSTQQEQPGGSSGVDAMGAMMMMMGSGGGGANPSSLASPPPPPPPPRFVDAASQTMDKALVDVNKAVYDADMQSRRSRGSHVPMGLRPYMSTFPMSQRIPSQGITTNTIMRILFKKLRHDQKRDQEGLRRLEMPHHVYEYFKDVYGSSKVADVQVVHFVRALHQHRSSHQRVRLFCQLVGADDVQAPPPLDLRDVNFLMEAVRYLEAAGEFGKKKEELQDKIILRRQRVVSMAGYLFGGFLPDCGVAFSRRMESMPGPTDTQVDFDDVMEEVTGQWLSTNDSWRSHLVYLFRRYCHTYVVLEELAFADDAGQKERDTLLVEVPRERLKKIKPRPLRLGLSTHRQEAGSSAPLATATINNSGYRPTTTSLSQTSGLSVATTTTTVADLTLNGARRQSMAARATTRFGIAGGDDDDEDVAGDEDDADGDAGHEGASIASAGDASSTTTATTTTGGRGDGSFTVTVEGGGGGGAGGTRTVTVQQGEPVVELMDKDLCRTALRKIDHRVEEAWVTAFFEEACERMLLRTKKALEEMWEARTGVGGVTTYKCVTTGVTQRTPPYELKTFRTYDIDVDTFVQLAVEHEILAKSPFIRLLDRRSEELWANRDVYLMQLQEGTIRQPAAPTIITTYGPAVPTGHFVLDPILVRRPVFKT